LKGIFIFVFKQLVEAVLIVHVIRYAHLFLAEVN